MKKLLENIIQIKTPNFKFDDSISFLTIVKLAFQKLAGAFRAFRILLHLKNPLSIFLGRRVKLFVAHKIFWGKWNIIGDNVKISALGKTGVFFGNNVSIGDFSRIIVSTSFNNIGKFIKIGNNVGIGEFAYLGGAGGLSIGNDCIVGQYLSCHPENHNFENIDLPIRLQGTSRRGIHIGNNCWIGSKVTILDGVRIGNNCVIAAGAVVNKNFPNNSIIGGVPAKLIKAMPFEKMVSREEIELV